MLHNSWYAICGSNLFYFPTDGSDDDGHHWAEDVEEAVGQIGDGRHAEDGALRHTAGVPRHQYAGHGGRVFSRATQQTRFVALSLIDILKHVGSQDDTNELVARGDVEEEACAGRRCHQPHTAAHPTDYHAGDTLNHSTGYHDCTETHGAEDEPDGIEHSRHAARRYQLVQLVIARVNRCRTIEGDGQSLDERCRLP